MAINGYDDGASTGEVRRFLGDALGPSDFRKNASRLRPSLRRARRRSSNCWIVGCRTTPRRRRFDATDRRSRRGRRRVTCGAARASEPTRVRPSRRGSAFRRGARGGPAVQLSRLQRRQFRVCRRLPRCWPPVQRRPSTTTRRCVGLPAGLIENVTDGTNAHLVALDVDGRVLGREAEIVDANRQNRIREIFLLPRPLEPTRARALAALGPDARRGTARGASVASGAQPAAGRSDWPRRI